MKTRQARAAGAAGGSTRCRDDRAYCAVPDAHLTDRSRPLPASKARSAVSSTPKSGWSLVALGQIGHASCSGAASNAIFAFSAASLTGREPGANSHHIVRPSRKLAADSPLITNGDRPSFSAFAFCKVGERTRPSPLARESIDVGSDEARSHRRIGQPPRPLHLRLLMIQSGSRARKAPWPPTPPGNGSRKRCESRLAATNAVAWPHSPCWHHREDNAIAI
jgi:hypothetical protein